MLTVSPETMMSLKRQREHGFALRVLAALTAEFPALFEPLPMFVRATLVCNGLDQAETWNFTLEKTICAFVALQCETAPDFFHSERVRPWLDPEVDEVARLSGLLAGVSPEVWCDIKRGADHRAWFEPLRPEQRAARIALQVCQVFPELVQHHPEDSLRGFFDAVPARGLGHGIDVESGLCVFAAALAFYGDALDKRHGPAWAVPLFFREAPLSPARLVALLRNALLVDSGRLI